MTEAVRSPLRDPAGVRFVIPSSATQELREVYAMNRLCSLVTLVLVASLGGPQLARSVGAEDVAPGKAASPKTDTAQAKKQAKQQAKKAVPGILTTDLSMTLKAPKQVEIGLPFDVVVEVKNTGSIALANVTTDTRGALQLEAAPRTAAEGEPLLKKKLRASSSARLVHRYVATSVGSYSLSASCREERGWAATGAAVTIEVVKPYNYEAELGNAKPALLDLVLELRVLDTVAVGKTFRVEFTVRNTGDKDLLNVALAWQSSGGVALAPDALLREDLKVLKAGVVHTRTVAFMAPKAIGKESRVLVSTRDGRGWAAGGAVLLLAALKAEKPKKPEKQH